MDFLRRRGSLVILVHCELSDGGGAGEGADVKRGVRLLDGAKPPDDGPRGVALGANNARGDALGNLGFSEGVLQQAVFGVIVNIDEAGGQDKTAGIDGRLIFFGLQFTDADDVAESNADVPVVERRAGAIGYACVDDKEGARLRLGEEREESHKRDSGHGTECAGKKMTRWRAKGDSFLGGPRSEWQAHRARAHGAICWGEQVGKVIVSDEERCTDCSRGLLRARVPSTRCG